MSILSARRRKPVIANNDAVAPYPREVEAPKTRRCSGWRQPRPITLQVDHPPDDPVTGDRPIDRSPVGRKLALALWKEALSVRAPNLKVKLAGVVTEPNRARAICNEVQNSDQSADATVSAIGTAARAWALKATAFESKRRATAADRVTGNACAYERPTPAIAIANTKDANGRAAIIALSPEMGCAFRSVGPTSRRTGWTIHARWPGALAAIGGKLHNRRRPLGQWRTRSGSAQPGAAPRAPRPAGDHLVIGRSLGTRRLWCPARSLNPRQSRQDSHWC